MPIRNRNDLIRESIQSIIKQTNSSWELLIIDDNSDNPDELIKIIKSYNDNRIKYHRLPLLNGYGQAAARNFGNMLAQSKYIAVMDSDDIASSDRISLTLDAFERYNCDLVYGELEIWYPESNKISLRPDKYKARPFDIEYFKKYDFIPHSTCTYMKKIAMNFPYNSFFTKACDYDFLSRVAEHGYILYYIDKILLKYRQHDRSISKTPVKYNFDDFIRFGRCWDKKKLLDN